MKQPASNSIEDSIRLFLRAIGTSELDEEALKNTPKRWISAMIEMTKGYKGSPKRILSKQFDEKSSSMIVVAGIPFWSLCKHHLLPFGGVCNVGYIPNGHVVGLSKIPRLVDCYAQRLQIQEAMGEQIADALTEHAKAKGAMVVVEATHTCACARGVKKENTMITSAIRGQFSNPEVRAEFLQLIRK